MKARRSAKSQLLTGLRGVGKTVLLNEFGGIARRHGFIVGQTEATEDIEFKATIASLVRKALLRLRARERLRERTGDVAAAGEDIPLEAVDAAVPIATDELDTGFFRARLDRATDGERNYMRAMASLGAGDYGSSEVAASFGKTTAQAGPVRERLIQRGLIYSPRWGRVAFTVPMFDEYVRRTLGELDS